MYECVYSHLYVGAPACVCMSVRIMSLSVFLCTCSCTRMYVPHVHTYAFSPIRFPCCTHACTSELVGSSSRAASRSPCLQLINASMCPYEGTSGRQQSSENYICIFIGCSGFDDCIVCCVSVIFLQALTRPSLQCASRRARATSSLPGVAIWCRR